MKKTLLLVAASAMLVSTTGCGTCRNLFSFRNRAAAPVVTQCMPTCAPVCCPPTCDDGFSGFSGSPVMYGYGGSATPMMMDMMDPSCNCGP